LQGLVYWDRRVYSDEQMRRAFYTSMSYSYASRINEWKQEYAKPKKTIPACVGEENWNRWLECWARPEEVARSEKASKNRKSAPVVHRAGSRGAHRIRDAFVSN
jgi:Plant transposase (Ptta/En/Spm family)